MVTATICTTKVMGWKGNFPELSSLRTKPESSVSSLSSERHLHGLVTQPEDSNYELRVEQRLLYPRWRLFLMQGQS